MKLVSFIPFIISAGDG